MDKIEKTVERNKGYTLITGGTMGIGYELAKLFADAGHDLIIVARDGAELATVKMQLEEEEGIKVITIAKDLFEDGAPYELYEEIKERELQVDILVNNAGQGQYGIFSDSELQKELAVIQLNISALVVLTKLFVQDMLEQGHGRILNLSSISSKTAGIWQSVYQGTKAFVQSFTEALHSELKDTGIIVTALLPGASDTDYMKKTELQDVRIVDEGKKGDAAKVAKEGFEAMMKGNDMLIADH